MSRRKTLSETAAQILAEAAVDNLQQSARMGQDPIELGPYPTSYDGQHNGDPLSNIENLGGATTFDPSGGPEGQLASMYAGKRGQAMQPQTAKTGKPTSPSQPMQAGAYPTSEIGVQYDWQTQDEVVQGEVEPTMATPNGQAPLSVPGATEYVPVDPMHEEFTAEEIALIKANRRASMIEYMKTMPVTEDLNAMFSGTQLTPEFQAKVKTIFEAAVIDRAVMVAEKLEEEILEAAEESVQEIKEELETQIDGYLDHVVENWMVQNEVAIESGLKTEIVEGFISGLKNLFTEHYIDVPEEQVNVVEAMAGQIEDLTAKLNETLNNNIELNKIVSESEKFNTLAKVCEGLTTTQAEKLQMLAEGVEFTSESEYAGKLATIRDNYFPKVNRQVVNSNPVVLSESFDPAPVEVQETVSPAMQSYLKTMTRISSRR